MSLDSGDGGTQEQGSSKSDVLLKKPRISYSTEFLLSLSNLDICKRLPSGFDESLLSGFEDASQSISERPRNPGSLPSHGFRRNDYSSSPPTRGDYNNNARGTNGKWESRSSGRSDRDSDSQSDRDSDSGRHHGYQSRRSWQTPEHDGLLGSGSFPRPSGCAAGISAPKVRAGERYQLSKSNEPYHPPRPYKAVPYSKRDTDSFNDETFGSIECTSEDRAEEERRRRASFEMMRKEQQKALQEKHNSYPEKHKDPLEEIKEKGLFVKSDEPELSVETAISSNESSFASHSPATRPLVPPGFRNSMPEKISLLKSSIHPPLLEVDNLEKGLEPEDNIVQTGSNNGFGGQFSQEAIGLDVQLEDKKQHALLPNKGENVILQTIVHSPIRKLSIEEKMPPSTSHLDSHGILRNYEIVEFNAEDLEEKSVGDSARNCSTSILTNIFGSTLSIKNDGGSSEHLDGKPDDAWNLNSSAQSSKFAQWFLDEEAKPADDISSVKPNGILSLLVKDKARHLVPDIESDEHVTQALKTLEHAKEDPLDMPSAPEPFHKVDVSPAVLTCEDLEQSILSEYCSKTTTDTQPVMRHWSANTAESEEPNACVEDHASLHLLSLLQKGTDQRNMNLDSGGASLSGSLPAPQEYDMGTAVDQHKAEDTDKNIPSSGKTLTLETLFGSAFMKELQSVEAPVSVQRGPNGSAFADVPEHRGLLIPVSENEIASPMINRIGHQRPSNEYGVSASNCWQQTKLSKADSWVGLDNSPIERHLQKHHSEPVSRHEVFEGVAKFQLPVEESLISVSDPRKHRMPTFGPSVDSSNNVNFSSNAHFDIKQKLSALSAAVKEEREFVVSENLPFSRGPFEQLETEIPYQSLQVQQPPKFLPPHMTQVRPSYQRLESRPAHLSSQMKFSNTEAMFNQDFPANPELSRNILRPPFHQPNVGASGFDVPAHNSMLHQMQMSANHLPQMLPDFARSGSVPHHGNQPTGLIQEMNQIQGFAFGPHQSNIGSHVVPIPGNPPEAFQRLIEMELRANSKQIQPPFSPGRNQGILGHELDTRLRYR